MCAGMKMETNFKAKTLLTGHPVHKVRLGHLLMNFWHLKHSSSHSGVTMGFTMETAIRNLTVCFTLLAMRWVHFCAVSATSLPRMWSFWGPGTQSRGETILSAEPPARPQPGICLDREWGSWPHKMVKTVKPDLCHRCEQTGNWKWQCTFP